MPIEETYPRFASQIYAARQAGYTDEDIQSHLQKKMQTAFKAGYSVDEVNKYLGDIPQPSITEPIKETGKELARMGMGVAGAFGGAALGTIAAPFTGPAAPAMPFVGAAAGSAGAESLSEYLFDEKINPRQIALQGILGAIPGFKAAGITSPAGRMAVRAGEGALVGGGASLASDIVEGEKPGWGKAFKTAVIGSLLGTGVGALEGSRAKTPEAKGPSLTKDQQARVDAIAKQLDDLEKLRQSPKGAALLRQELAQQEAAGAPAREAATQLEQAKAASDIEGEAFVQDLGLKRATARNAQDSAYVEAARRQQEQALADQGVIPQRQIPAEDAQAEASRLYRFLDVEGKPPYRNPSGSEPSPTGDGGKIVPEPIEARIARLEQENAQLRAQTKVPNAETKPLQGETAATQAKTNVPIAETAKPEPTPAPNDLRPAIRMKSGEVVTGEPGMRHDSVMSQIPEAKQNAIQETGWVGPEGKFMTPDEATAYKFQQKPTFEKTEAGMQGVIPGEEGRTVPEGPLRPKVEQVEGPLAIEAQPAKSIEQMSMLELMKKTFTDIGAVGKLSEDQAKREVEARAARREIYRRVYEAATGGNKTLDKAADELGVDPKIFNRIRAEQKIDEAVDSLGSAADGIKQLNERARMAVPEAETIASIGTLEKETRAPFREEAGLKPETYKFRFSEKDIDETRTRLIDASRKVMAVQREIEQAGDAVSSSVANIISERLNQATKEANQAADLFRKQRFAAGRGVKAFDRPPISADTLASLQQAGVLVDGLRSVKQKLPIYTNIVRSLKEWNSLTPQESVQFRRDLVDAFRLNLFSPTSFGLDLVSNLSETGAQITSGLASDLVHAVRGHPSMPSMQGMIRAIKFRQTIPELEIALGNTHGGEIMRGIGFGGSGPGTFTMREGLLSKATDYLVGAPLYAKNVVDTGFKRFTSNMEIWRQAIMEADRRGVHGLDRTNFFNEFWHDLPQKTLDDAIIEGNKAGYNRPLTHWEEAAGRSMAVRLFVDAFARWPFQFTRWAGEMLGYEPTLFKRIARGAAGPEEITRYLARTATGWGGLYLLDQTIYNKTDFNSMEMVDNDGNRVRLSSRDPIPTALFLLAVLHGDVNKATGALRYASIPGARLVLGEGGLLGQFTSLFAQGAKQGQLSTRQFTDQVKDAVNRAIPGQAVLSSLKTIFDPTVREGIGSNLPGISVLKEPVIDLSTGEPLEPKQKLFGMEFPSIAGTPIPGATRLLEPTAKLLSRYGVMAYRGPRSPVAGYPASQAPEDVTHEWEIEFGKARDKMLGALRPSIEAAETRVSDDQRKPGSPFYERARSLITKYDATAARYATAVINRRHLSADRLPRKPSAREGRAPSEVYHQ